MYFSDSSIGCSVKALSDLGHDQLEWDRWSEEDLLKFDKWGWATNLSELGIFSKKGLARLIRRAKSQHTGILIWADNVDYGNGQKLAKHLLDLGYKVERTKTYVNKNHNSKCAMWIWYLNEKRSSLDAIRSRTANGRKKISAAVASTKRRVTGRK